MLQNIRDRLTGPFVWFIVGIIVIPFAFFGIETFRSGGADPTLAKVGDQKITQSQFRQGYDQRLQQLQQLMGDNFRPELFDQGRFRQSVLDDMVQESLLRQHVRDAGYRASDGAVFETLSAIPAFQDKGRFSSETYRSRLAQQGYSPTRFETQLRDSLVIDQMREGILASALMTDAATAPAYRLDQQRRALSYAVFEVSRHLSQVQVTAEQVQARYDGQKARHQAPERIRLAYVELALADLPAAEKPNPEVLRVLYDADKATRFSTPEERRARHILINFGVDKDAARKRATALAEQARTSGRFAPLAEAESQDPGSKGKGGDLGWIRRGQMLEKFEQALFAMKPGAVSEPVETEFGWHVIKLEEIREARTSAFEDAAVQAELLRVYRQRDGERRFQDLSEKLEQVSFESPNALEPAAQALGVKVQTTEWIARAGGRGIAANPAVIEAAFSEDVLQNGENSRVLSLGDSRIAVIRKLEYEPPRQRPLEEVADGIRTDLRGELAKARAASDAQASLAAVSGGKPAEQVVREHGTTLKSPGLVGRQFPGIDAPVLDALFRLPRPEAGKPQWTQVALPNGDVVIVGATAVEDGDWAVAAEGDRQRERGRWREAAAGAEFAAYRADLQRHIDVKMINPPEGEPQE